MEKKEFHRANLPHFQQPGQEYFVTWNLKDAVPAKAIADYTQKLVQFRNNIDIAIRDKKPKDYVDSIRFEYNILRKKMMKAYEDYLHLNNKTIVNLSKPENTAIVHNALCFWEGKRLKNYVICVMPNHVHWVFRLLEKDENNDPVWLENILKSVKQYTSTQINIIENQKGSLWHKESWDTTIRDSKHLHAAIEYTKNNPVAAGLVNDWCEWKGTLLFE